MKQLHGVYGSLLKTFAILVVGLLFAAQPAFAAESTWTYTGSANDVRFAHMATLLPDGKVLVVGGIDNDLNRPQTAELYDPVTGTWTATGSLVGDGRYVSTATLLPNGKVLVAGGLGKGPDGSIHFLAEAELFDPDTGTWSVIDSMNAIHIAHTATLLPNGKVLIAGGSDNITASAISELYDPSSGTWSVVTSMNTPRYGHTATLLPNGQVLIAGGLDAANVPISSAELYDPVTDTWNVTDSLADAREQATATLLPNGKVLVAGGFNFDSPGGFENDLAVAELYDPTTGTWSTAGSMASGRNFTTATLLLDGNVLVAGGINGSALATSELYDSSAGTWALADSMNGPRYHHTATLLTSGKVLIVGGGDAISLATSTAELYGLSDNQAPILSPIGNKTVDEGQVLTFTASSTDPDGDAIIFSATGLPSGATFATSTGVFNWTPNFSQAGNYNVTFTATDNGTPPASATTSVTIIVNNVAPLELTATADSFVANGDQNRNEGANSHLSIQNTGNRRSLAGFDATAISNYVAAHGITSAQLIFTISDNGNNWGTIGRTVDAMPLTTTFAEGNGKSDGVPLLQKTRGTGSGTTWNCAIDTAIENIFANCASQWNGGTFGAATATSVNHTNSQSGQVTWNVTADVLAGRFGWLVKKTNENQNGSVDYYSKEGAAAAGNMQFAPRLILTP